MAAYNPGEVIVSAFGGIADGVKSVEVERNEDGWSQDVSTDGDVLDVKSLNDSGTMTLVLQQSSRFNDFLSAVWNADRLTGRAAAVVGIRDMNGTTLVSGFQCRIRKPPSAKFGDKAEDRTWVIQIGKLQEFIGGED